MGSDFKFQVILQTFNKMALTTDKLGTHVSKLKMHIVILCTYIQGATAFHHIHILNKSRTTISSNWLPQTAVHNFARAVIIAPVVEMTFH